MSAHIEHLNSRDVTARIERLKGEWAESTGDNPDDFVLSGDDWRAGLSNEEANELAALLAFVESGTISAATLTAFATLLEGEQ